jgi:hypothetical protein
MKGYHYQLEKILNPILEKKNNPSISSFFLHQVRAQFVGKDDLDDAYVPTILHKKSMLKLLYL